MCFVPDLAFGLLVESPIETAVVGDVRAEMLREVIAVDIGKARYDLWFGEKSKISCYDRIVKIELTHDTQFALEWVEKQFGNDLVRGCKRVYGAEFNVELAGGNISICLHDGATIQQTNCSLDPSVALPGAKKEWFQAFVQGTSNRTAFVAARAAVEKLGAVTPLVVFGPGGCGKTHLLRAIQEETRKATTLYLSAEQFTASFLEAFRCGALPSFRQRCRRVDVLLLDDLQYLVGKRRTTEELRYTIDSITAGGRQVVLASRRSLEELRPLGHETTSRLTGGLVCEIGPPESALRMELVRKFGEECDLVLPEDVVHFVAEYVGGSARELRGAVHLLQAKSSAFEQPISCEFARQSLSKTTRNTQSSVGLSDVEKVVCDVFGVEPAKLKSGRKERSLTEPRMLAIWLARKYTRSPWSAIGEFFGGRSHSTVISAHRRVEQLIAKTDHECGGENVQSIIRRMESALLSGSA